MPELNTTILFSEEFSEVLAERVAEKIKLSVQHKTSEPADKIMGVPELSKYLGMSVKWVYDRIKENSIPHIKLGNVLKFRQSTIDRWIESLSRPESSIPPSTFVKRLRKH